MRKTHPPYNRPFQNVQIRSLLKSNKELEKSVRENAIQIKRANISIDKILQNVRDKKYLENTIEQILEAIKLWLDNNEIKEHSLDIQEKIENYLELLHILYERYYKAKYDDDWESQTERLIADLERVSKRIEHRVNDELITDFYNVAVAVNLAFNQAKKKRTYRQILSELYKETQEKLWGYFRTLRRDFNPFNAKALSAGIVASVLASVIFLIFLQDYLEQWLKENDNHEITRVLEKVNSLEQKLQYYISDYAQNAVTLKYQEQFYYGNGVVGLSEAINSKETLTLKKKLNQLDSTGYYLIRLDGFATPLGFRKKNRYSNNNELSMARVIKAQAFINNYLFSNGENRSLRINYETSNSIIGEFGADETEQAKNRKVIISIYQIKKL